MQNKIRASYSFLSAWQSGQIDRALSGYFHIPQDTPWNYQDGEKWDRYSADFVEDNFCLPPEWGGEKLKKPTTQYKTLSNYNEICDLVTVFDILDTPILWELKSGKTSAKAYAKTPQVPLYLLQCKLAQIPVKIAIISRFNQHDGQVDRAELEPTTNVLERATNYLDSIVPEIYSYFEDHDLLGKSDEEMRHRLIRK